MKFVELNEIEYSNFQQKHRYNTFLNSIDTYHLEQLENLDCKLVGLKEQDEVLCAALIIKYPMMKKFSFYYAPRGILVDYENKELLKTFAKELKKYMKAQGAIQFVIDPYVLYKERDADGNEVEGGFNNESILNALQEAGFIHQGFSTGYDQNMQTIRWMYSTYLEGYTEQSLWKALHQQTRWSINRTLKYKMQIKELSKDELDVFVDIMNQTGQRRGFDIRGKAFYEHQMEAYGDRLKLKLAYIDTNLLRSFLEEEYKQNLKENEEIDQKLLEVPNSKKFNKKKKVILEALDISKKRFAEVDELEKNYGTYIPMAASMFIYDKDEVIYLTSGAYEQFRDYYASYAIQWHVIQEAMAMGYKKYNFYGISGVFDPNDENYGVYAFKRGFPGKVEELLGDFVLVINPMLYKLYKTLKK